jgi:hypothetical protein
VPAPPISLWTDSLLLKHASLVKCAQLALEDIHALRFVNQLSDDERSLYDNASPFHGNDIKYGAGPLIMARMFIICPLLEWTSVEIPSREGDRGWVLCKLKRLTNLKIGHCGMTADAAHKFLSGTTALHFRGPNVVEQQKFVAH